MLQDESLEQRRHQARGGVRVDARDAAQELRQRGERLIEALAHHAHHARAAQRLAPQLHRHAPPFLLAGIGEPLEERAHERAQREAYVGAFGRVAQQR